MLYTIHPFNHCNIVVLNSSHLQQLGDSGLLEDRKGEGRASGTNDAYGHVSTSLFAYIASRSKKKKTIPSALVADSASAQDR